MPSIEGRKTGIVAVGSGVSVGRGVRVGFGVAVAVGVLVGVGVFVGSGWNGVAVVKVEVNKSRLRIVEVGVEFVFASNVPRLPVAASKKATFPSSPKHSMTVINFNQNDDFTVTGMRTGTYSFAGNIYLDPKTIAKGLPICIKCLPGGYIVTGFLWGSEDHPDCTFHT
jgi:hypothetical protein